VLILSHTWIQTFSGRAFDFQAPDPAAICLEDIAHALSQLCRFNGHCCRFESVAEHSWLVAKRALEILPPGLHGRGLDLAVTRTALMHDAAEAYIGDVVTPLRRALRCAALVALEQTINQLVASRFHLDVSPEVSAVVMQADLDLLAIEQHDLMVAPPQPWGLPAPPSNTRVKIIGMSPQQANQTFLRAAQQYGVQ
jgi:hypothetical protein